MFSKFKLLKIGASGSVVQNKIGK